MSADRPQSPAAVRGLPRTPAARLGTDPTLAGQVAGSVGEGRIQLAIMRAIGLAAGAASFTHVHDVAAAHAPDGLLAWADAVVLELMAVASGLEMRRRRRAGTSVRFPAAVLVVAVVLSVSAQVVGAERSVIGWIAAAIPALGFLVMVKIALAQTHAPSVSATEAPTAETSTSADRRLAAAPAAIGELITMIDPVLMSAARERPVVSLTRDSGSLGSVWPTRCGRTATRCPMRARRNDSGH